MNRSNAQPTPPGADAAERARRSGGISDEPIYRMVVRALDERGIGSGTILDVGCGTGNLHPFVAPLFDRYLGADLIRYDGFPDAAEFLEIDLDGQRVPLDDGTADVVISVETIEHLENPRAFFRELTRLARPGGWVVVTTPNQLSFLSLLTLVVKKRFAAFQDVHYPAHLTALLEIDLQRIATECGLGDLAMGYSLSGRVVLTPRSYPAWLARRWPRALSDNLLIIGRKAGGGD